MATDILSGAKIVLFNPAEAPKGKVVCVGVGDKTGLNDDVEMPQLTLCGHTYIALNGESFRGAMEDVLSASDSTLAAWKAGLRAGAAGPFDGVTLVVEDAAPDTCMALIGLARRWAGLPIDETWISYTRLWKQGDVRRTGKPEESWGALLSALVHPYFWRGARSNSDVEQALRSALRFTLDLMESGQPPMRVVSEEHAPDLWQARERLEIERRKYLSVRDGGVKLQLAVPFAASKDIEEAAQNDLTSGTRLVDALVLVEPDALGTMKIWARTDRESQTHEGYGILVIHRPSGGSHPSELTITVDPFTGLNLRDLWIELERRENEAWRAAGLERPCDKPRPLYSTERGLATPCNEPWFDEGGRYTLISAPRQLRDGRPGSLLSLDDVIHALWTVYPVDRGSDLEDRTGYPSVSLVSSAERRPVRAQLGNAAGKWLIDCKANDQVRGAMLVAMPTFLNAAALNLRFGAVLAQHLSEKIDFDVHRAPGGMTLVSADGVFMMATGPAGFPGHELRVATQAFGDRLRVIRELELGLRNARRHAQEAVSQGSTQAKTRALATIYHYLLQAEASYAPEDQSEQAEKDPYIQKVLGSLECRWRLRERAERVVSKLNELENMVVSSSEIRTNGAVSALAIYGFPLALFMNLIGSFALQPLHDSVLRGEIPEQSGWLAFGVGWHLVSVYAALAGLLIFVLWLFQRRSVQLWTRSVKQPPPPPWT